MIRYVRRKKTRDTDVSRLSFSLLNALEPLDSLTIGKVWNKRKRLSQVICFLTRRRNTFNGEGAILDMAPKPVRIHMVIFGATSQPLIIGPRKGSIVVFEGNADNPWNTQTRSERKMPNSFCDDVPNRNKRTSTLAKRSILCFLCGQGYSCLQLWLPDQRAPAEQDDISCSGLRGHTTIRTLHPIQSCKIGIHIIF